MEYRDKEYILEIIGYCEGIIEALKRFGSTYEAFLGDADYRDSVYMKIFQIGECTNQISDSVKESHKEIPWDKMYGIRNIIAHAYVQIDDEIVWETIKSDIPELQEKLEEII